MNAWKRLSSGKYIDLNNLSLKDIDMADIEPALNYIYRFTGHHKDAKPLTVAQHSLLVCALAAEMEDDPQLELACLVHDFAEAYIGDVATPVKRMMGAEWYKFSRPIEELVETKFLGAPMDQEMHDRVKLYDLAALDIERRVLWSSQYGKNKWPETPLNTGKLSEKLNWFEYASDNEYIKLSEYMEKISERL